MPNFNTSNSRNVSNSEEKKIIYSFYIKKDYRSYNYDITIQLAKIRPIFALKFIATFNFKIWIFKNGQKMEKKKIFSS